MRMSVVVLSGLSAHWLLRRQSAAIRHWILSATIFSAAAVPALTLFIPSFEVIPPLPIEDMKPFELIVTPAASDEEIASVKPANLLWILSLPVGGAVLVAGLLRLAWIASRASCIRDGKWTDLTEEISKKYELRRPVRLLQNHYPSMLATWGFSRPKILLPAGAADWPEERIRSILSHELAHVRRHDWLVQMAAEVLRAIYWFNPLLWLACTRLRRDSEHACDDAALNLGIAPSEYAGHLLDQPSRFRT